jgi:hypothetical protein
LDPILKDIQEHVDYFPQLTKEMIDRALDLLIKGVMFVLCVACCVLRVVCGVWRVVCGVWRVVCGVVCGVWCGVVWVCGVVCGVACGVWRVVCGVCVVWCVVWVCGVWRVACGVHVVCGVSVGWFISFLTILIQKTDYQAALDFIEKQAKRGAIKPFVIARTTEEEFQEISTHIRDSRDIIILFLQQVLTDLLAKYIYAGHGE